MNKRNSLYVILAVLIIGATLLSACAPAATATTAPATAAPEETKPVTAALSVGVVLPTKNEPRWIQDETRFMDAFTAAGYDVQILFSDGDSAKEKANVESLINQGVKVIIICPHDGTAAAAAAVPSCGQMMSTLMPLVIRDSTLAFSLAESPWLNRISTS